jgi:hypothetical protein
VEHARSRLSAGIGQGRTRQLSLGLAMLLSACGEGPTENDTTRICTFPVPVNTPVASNPDIPVTAMPISPVLNGSCRADSPVIRFPARDSTIIAVPVPRPVPQPNPGGD